MDLLWTVRRFACYHRSNIWHREEWSIDKLTITDGFGKEGSFCKEEGELLLSGIPITRWLPKVLNLNFSSENFNQATVFSPTKKMRYQTR